MKTPLEKDIQRTILDWLQLKHIFCWRENTMGSIHNHNGRQFFRPNDMVGKSDIIGVLPDGRFLAIEVKRKGGKVSEAQQSFISNVLGNGGVAFVAMSLEDLFDNFKKFNIKI